MIYKASEIAELLELEQPKYTDSRIEILLTDSRSVVNPESSLFFALVSSTGDGHNFIYELYGKGVRNFVVEKLPSETFDQANFFVVDDSLAALQRVAAKHRSRFNIPVVAITGSRGKTTVKEWLYQAMCGDYHITRAPRSYNSQVGVPLSVWELDEDTNLGIFEAGISQPGEMDKLRDIISPTHVVITNIGNEHHEGFASIKAKCLEKISLMRNCDRIIYNADDELICAALNECGISAIRFDWSKVNPEASLYVRGVSRHDNDLVRLMYTHDGIDGEFTLKYESEHDIENQINTFATMLSMGYSHVEAEARMARLYPVDTRLNVIEGVNNCLLVHDTYPNDFASLYSALDFIERRSTSSRSLAVILSDLEHDSKSPSVLYRAVADLLRSKGIECVIGIGEEISGYGQLFSGKTMFFHDVEALLAEMSPSDFIGQFILIKGAAHFGFDSIRDMLEAKQHETVLEVDLDAVAHNFKLYRSYVKPTTGIVAMVKASGYGAGSYEIAKTLQNQGAAYLAVAVLDEGVALREAGITMPIMVLNPKVVNYRAMFDYKLEPEIYSFEMLDEIVRVGEKCGVTGYPVHIKLDTGMHRLGFLEKDMPRVVEFLSAQNVISPKSIFSHLAAADDPNMDDYTLSQFEIFHRSADVLQRGFSHKILKHILNSTGITRFPEHQCDMVRLGICLYGVPTMTDHSQDELHPVSSLRTVIISIKEWDAGTTIGYNRRGVLKRKSLIATIPVGYADGINRHLGNGNASFMVNGHRCPTVGNICMDICMIDVTDASCRVGQSVEIFGNQISVCEIADTLGTIPYEILTSVSERVKRVYYRE